jgi:hypothetical protein
MEERHLVQKYIFDVEFNSESKAIPFQNQLMPYVKEKLLSLTDDIFNEESVDKSISIEKLTIDLGNISLINFEEEIYSLLKTRLRDKLRLLLAGIDTEKQEEQITYISTHKTGLEIIEFFLLNGALPWSARRSGSDFSIKDLINRLVEEIPEQVKKLYDSLVIKEETRLRMVRQLDDQLLWMIIQLWAGSETEKMKSLYSDLIAVFIKKPVVKRYFSEYREMVWQFILQEIILHKRYKQSHAEAVEKFISFVSAANKTSPENILILFYNAIHEKGSLNKATGYQTSLPDLMVELIKKNKLNQWEEKGDSNKFEEFRQKLLKEKQDYLIHFIKTVLFISDKEGIRQAIERAENIIKELIALNPVFLAKILKEAKFEIDSFRSQQIAQLLNVQVWDSILEKVFKTDKNNFVALRKQSRIKVITAFLETGYYPFTYLPPNFGKSNLGNLFLNFYEEDKETFKKIIRDTLLSGTGKSFRIEQLKKYLPDKTVNKIFYDFPQIIASGGSSEENIKKLADLKTFDSLMYLVRYFLDNKYLPPRTKFSISELIDHLYSLYGEEAAAYLTTINKKEMKQIEKAVSPSTAHTIAIQGEKFRKEVSQVSQAETLPSEDRKEKEPDHPAKKLPEGEPIYINNAGLVIFHPYLGRFFKMFDLLDNRIFKDEFSAHKAVYLLQYLVNKGMNSEEHELILNKLLCGIDLQVPLIRDIEITEKEKDTCEGLIDGVIQNWPALKKTSHDNFRASFLMREGRMLQGSEKWMLKVEERGYDILVEKLPWSISMIKLPWMNNMIQVEWK